MRKRVKSNFLLCITAIFLFVFSMQVYADDHNVLIDHESTRGEKNLIEEENLEKVDASKTGSIAVKLTEGSKGTSRENVEFACTKVGEITKGEYILKEEFLSSGVDLNTIELAKDMEAAAKKISRLDISADKVLRTDKDGKLSFVDLPTGVYFLEATDTVQYEKVTPFLISIPTFDDKEGEMVYDIQVVPKHEPEPGKITTDSPGRPSAPQTGLDSPILKYFGGVAIIVSLLIIFNVGAKKQRKNNEEID